MFGRHSDERGEEQARNVRFLGRRKEREAIGSLVVFSYRGARLYRIRDQTIVNQLERRHVLGSLECGLGGDRIAEMPLINSVVGGDLVQLRRIGRLRLD